jgi:hypothetical protein
LAERLIAKKGRALSIRLVTDTALTPDPDPRPWQPPASQVAEAILNVKGVILDARRMFFEGTLIKIVEKKAYIAVQNTGAADVAISKKDVLVDGTREYRIETLELLAPGDQAVLYILELRS